MANIQHLFNQATQLHQSGRIREAIDLYVQLLPQQRNNPQLLYMLGCAKLQIGQHRQAIEELQRSLILDPRNFSAQNNIAIAFKNLKRLDEALVSYDKAIALKPDFAEAHYNRGNVLKDLKRLDEALASYEKAISLNPDHADAYNNRGNTLKELQRPDEALASYNKAILLKPDYADAHSNRGNTLKDLGHLSEADTSYRQAIALKPDFAEAYYNLGNVLKDLRRLGEALSSYDKAIALKPDYAEAHSNVGNTLQDLGRLSEAAASYRQAVALKPGYAEAHSNLLFCMNYIEKFSATTGLEEALQYGSNVSRKATDKYTSWRCPQAPDKLRIGFVSGDLKNHPVGYFLEGLLSNIDRSRFELIAYTNAPIEDELTKRIQPHFKLWQSLLGKTDEAAAKMIHDDGIHILIDLAGHTAHSRLPVFAYKPAPVQVAWLGYFSTTGVPEIDYLLGDPYVTPEEEQHHFSERIWRLPETYLCFTPPNLDLEVGDLPALSNGYVTFGCFNNLSKMNDAVVASWSKILDSVKGSRLFLKARQFADPQTIERTLERFEALSIARDRLLIERASSREDYFKSYNRVDIALDPFPFPGGTTSVEGLWMGVPVITKKGDRFISHNGETIANNTGQSEWIAQDENDYVLKAKFFASDLNSLAVMRSGLRAQVLSSPLFDSKRFSRHFENAMTEIWEKLVVMR